MSARRRRGRPVGDETAERAVNLAVDALAAYRLTRLLTVDTLPPAETAREWVKERARQHQLPAVVELLECPWCIGFWISLGVVVGRAGFGRRWDPAARTLAVSTVVGIIAAYLSDEVVQVKPAVPETPSIALPAQGPPVAEG
jgi:hypothetical protein